MKISDKLYNFVSLYRSPSQTQGELEQFSKNLERSLDHLFQNSSFLVVLISDFNVKSSSCYYLDKSSLEGNAVDTIIKQYGPHQVIKKPKHLLDNSSTCITSQVNLIIESDVYLCILITIIRLHMRNLTYRFIFLHPIHERFETIKMQILNSCREQLRNLIGKDPF